MSYISSHELETPLDAGQEIPTNIDFATEVKADRLSLLSLITAYGSIGLVIIMLTIIVSAKVSQFIWIYAPLTLGIGSFITRFLLRRKLFDFSAVFYVLTLVAAMTVAMLDKDPQAMQVLPFIFVMIIFVGGLLIRPQITLLLALVCAVLLVAVPAVSTGSFAFFGVSQFFAIILIFLSALLSIQATGELYSVTEWALLNYRKESQTNQALFDNREKLQRSLKRSEVLAEELSLSNVELEEARKTAEAAKNFRGQFLANMSHELRTPLNAIIGFSETMLKFPIMYDNEELPEAYKADLNQIFNSGRQLLHLINDILDLARVDAGKLEIYMQRVQLKPVIDAVMGTARGLLGEKQVQLKGNIPDPLPEVWADESRVRQVLLNLYSNAVKFTNEGSITLTVQEVPDGVQFSLSDTGAGIPADQFDVIFEEFRQVRGQTRPTQAGSGLGLPISRRLLELMNGRIWMESEVGKGSTFHFVLQPYQKSKFETMETTTTLGVDGSSSSTIQTPQEA
ncbi:MAG: HAMP domain-containing sensor histidine kinase [bacterium]|nr:HAMP domain-containing sensor histidine kinase [bacterium]